MGRSGEIPRASSRGGKRQQAAALQSFACPHGLRRVPNNPAANAVSDDAEPCPSEGPQSLNGGDSDALPATVRMNERFCRAEVPTVNSLLELTVGS